MSALQEAARCQELVENCCCGQRSLLMQESTPAGWRHHQDNMHKKMFRYLLEVSSQCKRHTNHPINIVTNKILYNFRSTKNSRVLVSTWFSGRQFNTSPVWDHVRWQTSLFFLAQRWTAYSFWFTGTAKSYINLCFFWIGIIIPQNIHES